MSPKTDQTEVPSRHPMLHLFLLAWLAIVALAALVPLRAGAEDGSLPITVASLKGTWQMTLIGQTGCGFGTSVVFINLDEAGNGVATSQYHTVGCSDGSSSGPTPFTVQVSNADGSGTANLSCGPGCGWNLIIQVSGNGQMFNVVDVDAMNPNNFIEGTAVRRRSKEKD